MSNEYSGAVEELTSDEEFSQLARRKRLESELSQQRAILEAWESQQNDDRKLRKRYANWLLGLVSIQVFLMSAAFFALGLGYLKFQEVVAEVFMVGTFTEISALVLIVVRYLFPSGSNQLPGAISPPSKRGTDDQEEQHSPTTPRG